MYSFPPNGLGDAVLRVYHEKGKKSIVFSTIALFLHWETSIGANVAFVAFLCWSGVDTGHQPQHSVNGRQRRAAVADEGQGQADNGGHADAHADVADQLEHQRRSRSKAHQAAHIVRAADAHMDAADDDEQQHDHNGNASHEAQLLADGRENIVCVTGHQVVGLGPVAVKQALARNAAAIR